MLSRSAILVCLLVLTVSVINGDTGRVSKPAKINKILKNDTEGEKPIVCYYTYYGKGSDLQPEKIDVNICTHILVGFASVVNNTVSISTELYNGFQATVALKTKRPDLKVMFSIGGGGNDEGFSLAVRTTASRKILTESIMSIIEKLKMDGVDIDWEFPSWFSPIEDKENFARLLKEFRETTDKLKKQVLLSVAVSATLPIIEASYDPLSLAAYCDFINLMSYDFHDYKPLEDPFTGFNSPLFARAIEKAYFATLNLAYSAEYWVKIGVPRSKLYVGIPVYSHLYELALDSLTGVDAPATGGGGDWSYSQCCKFIVGGATTKFDTESLVPYMYKNLTWVSYENEQSVTYKAKWIKSQNFGGIMVFNINTDDWIQSCGPQDFPLIKAIKMVFNS